MTALEPQVSDAIAADVLDTMSQPLDRDVLALRAAARTADRLGDLTDASERIATALEGLLLILDTRGEVSGYLTGRSTS